MKLIIDLPNKTIAHIRSDYGHKYFGCIGDEDKKIIMKAIYDGTPLEEALENQKTGHWIPVSERLPEESLNSVIGWDAYRERCVFVQYINGYFQITGRDESFDIVAWMPLPEPYKAESEE